MKELISFDEANRRAMASYDDKPKGSGIACPKCGAEIKVQTDFVLTSYPPSHAAWCDSCEWTGHLTC